MQTGLLPLGGVLVIGDDKLDSSLLIANVDGVQCLADRDKFVVDTALFECRCHRAIDNDPRTCWGVSFSFKKKGDQIYVSQHALFILGMYSPHVQLKRGLSTEGFDFGGAFDDLIGDIGLLENHAKGEAS